MESFGQSVVKRTVIGMRVRAVLRMWISKFRCVFSSPPCFADGGNTAAGNPPCGRGHPQQHNALPHETASGDGEHASREVCCSCAGWSQLAVVAEVGPAHHEPSPRPTTQGPAPRHALCVASQNAGIMCWTMPPCAGLEGQYHLVEISL